MEPMVHLREVSKRFGRFVAVDGVSLDIRAGEFLTLLGPSGCGKTTLLRMISGFETPTSGTVWLDGRDVTFEPPYRRDVNQVFQSYALFPHLNVEENIAFGLEMRKVPKAEAKGRVAEVVELVSLQGFERRSPSQLSGGQRQRVALARAIVCKPKVLLLDEPLSALDAKLRFQMQAELKRLQKKLGITFVFVTHDQEEALAMSDRIAVVNEGRIEQLGNVDEIYHAPRTRFVANFIGQANIMEAQIVARNGDSARIKLSDDVELATHAAGLSDGAATAMVSIRPEKVLLQQRRMEGENIFEAVVVEELFRGATDQLVVRTEGGLELTVVVANESASEVAFHEGDRVFCRLHRDDIALVQEG